MLDENKQTNKQTNNNNNKREHLIARCHPKEHLATCTVVIFQTPNKAQNAVLTVLLEEFQGCQQGLWNKILKECRIE